METKDLFKLYEKLYFHEIENRDKITSRSQLPLAIFATLISFLGLMLKGVDFNCAPMMLTIFWVLLVISSISVISGVIYFIKSFYGHSYEFIPTASATEQYKNDLSTTYEEYENGTTLAKNYLQAYLYRYYHECSSKNSIVNDYRSKCLHRSNTLIIISLLPILLTFLIFNFGNVDSNRNEKIQKVIITNPLKLELPNNLMKHDTNNNQVTTEGGNSHMSKKKETSEAPPPPPPPPKRIIREDINIGQKGNQNKKGDNNE